MELTDEQWVILEPLIPGLPVRRVGNASAIRASSGRRKPLPCNEPSG
jgi:hypothetical protein